MAESERQESLSQIIMVGVLPGIGATFACAAVLLLLGLEPRPAVSGAVGGVVGILVLRIVRRRSGGHAI